MGKGKVAALKVFGYIDAKTKISPEPTEDEKQSLKQVDQTNFKGEIELKDVWFRYPTRKDEWVFKGISFKINSRESVALVGESGCGKSTLVNLLLRYYDVDFGEILVDGINI